MPLPAHHEEGTLYAADERPNLSPLALEKLAALDSLSIPVHPRSSPAKKVLEAGDGRGFTGMKNKNDSSAKASDPTDLFFHALAILHAPVYRESRLLGRALSPDEAAHFTHMARRIAALLALGTELDVNYRANAAG